MSTDHVPEIPGYRVMQPLGRGGMASVYLAMQESVEREVALKIMAPQLSADSTFGERFLREARIAAKLHHRHVVSIYDVGVYNGFHYCTMEYLPGGPVMKRGSPPLALKPALRCVREIAMALHYAQAKGFIHRDVKPDNILLREDGSSVLGDFGIARAADSGTQMTKAGSVVGTPHYMSPEQLRGREIDGRADLYSLGVVFFQLITGRVPFEASDSLAIGIMHMTAPLPQLPSEYRALQPILDRMLAKEPGDRYQTGAEIDAALAEVEKEMASAHASPPLARVGESPTRPMPSLRGERKSGYDPQNAVRTEPQLGHIDRVEDEGMRATPRQTQFTRVRQSPPASRAGLWVLLATILVASGAAYWQLPAITAWLQSRSAPTPAPAPPELAAADARPDATAGTAPEQTLPEPTPPVPEPVPDTTGAADLAAAQRAEAEGRLDGPSGALARFASALSLDAANAEALKGVDRVAAAIAGQARSYLAAGDTAAAERLQRELAVVSSASTMASALAQEIAKSKAVLDQRSQIPDLLAEAGRLAKQGRLVEPANASAADRYRAVLAIEPGNGEAKDGLARAVTGALTQVEAAIEIRELDRAKRLLDRVQRLAPKSVGLAGARERLNDAVAASKVPDPSRIAAHDRLIAEGELALASEQWLEPAGDSAYDKFKGALAIDPRSERARAGMQAIALALRQRIDRSLSSGQATRAHGDFAALETVDPRLTDAIDLKRRIARAYAENGLRSLERGSQEQARADLIEAEQLDASESTVASLRSALGG
jgi:serine/threonine protein kinase/tetratricopeptide (TPR) repeat protein